ncbi:methionine adenosyltransferase [Anaeromyxobacter oryzae]|uniref:Methionine adenosyltransferase n=1 Tax=Anaeromyxobacter oryzae TaxID=2918170 RepID=A0ABN6MQ17_9BACT|nr:methionine adenosyltransferase [Anaeromyxobacter oryzae]BDG02380.1 S-adenosylmethionine synthase [Anaeromyxobacter oryzae]
MPRRHLFTSESVSEGHPDKVADRISDEILDAHLREGARARVAIETLVTTDRCVVAGEVRGPSVGVEEIARRAVRDIGYEAEGFSWRTLRFESHVHAQSAEIAQGVDREDGEEGAGDQGLMFGFACRETPELMPAPLQYAHRILERFAARRKAGDADLGPDGKSQLTLEYEDGRPVRVHTAVVSHQHSRRLSSAALRDLVDGVLREVLPGGWLDAQTRVLVNPTGSFVHGGPAADTGLTGRKIIVDTYGGAAPHGGGAFSGKDPSKVDRSAAYAARYLAKNVVAAGLADRCVIQLAYAIGVAEPLALYVDTQGTGTVPEDRIAAAIRTAVSLTPRAIRERLGLARPIYARTSAYGHFGRTPQADGGFSWERADLVEALQRAA